MTTPLLDPGLSAEECAARCARAGAPATDGAGAGAGAGPPVVRPALGDPPPIPPAPGAPTTVLERGRVFAAAQAAQERPPTGAALAVGPYQVAAGGPGWRAVSREGAATGLVGRLAEGPQSALRLRALARRWGRLAERAAAAPALEAVLPQGDGALLVVQAARGEPLQGAPSLDVALRVALELALLDEGLRATRAWLPYGFADVRVRTEGGRLAVELDGLERLQDELGVDPRRGAVQWGAVLAALVGAPAEEHGWDLEAAPPRTPPPLLRAVRCALRGESTPLALLAQATGARLAAAPTAPARLAAARGQTGGGPGLEVALDRVAGHRPEPAADLALALDPEPPTLGALVGPDGATSLRAEGLSGPAVVVRARGDEPLLLPEDGDVVATLAPDASGVVGASDARTGARYALFPLDGPSSRPRAPGRARPRAAVDVEALAARPRIGAIELAWTAPQGATVVLRGGVAPIATPADGELLAWTKGHLSFVHDCLDAGQEVHYRAFAVDPRGGFTPGAAASAVALGPPPALGPVKATPGDRQVALAWSWPEGRSYDRVRVARSPAWPEGEREVLATAAPALVDAGCPAGQTLTYTLRAALGPTLGRRETTVSAKAVLELARFEAKGGGRSVVLELALPEGAPHGTSVEVVRNTERVPQDTQDGGFVRVGRATRYVDEPLPAGAVVHYRACLVVEGARSPGLVASATPVERAGALSGVEVAAEACAVAVRFQRPTERCDDVLLEAGPAGGALAPVALAPGATTARVPCPPGVTFAVRLVPVFQGNADATQAVERTAVAFDAPADLAGRGHGGKVELTWTPPAAPPRAWRLRRTIKGGKADDPGVELVVAPDAASFADADVQTRRTYVYALSARWGPEAGEVETPPLVVEVPVHAEPAALEKPEVRSTGGAVLVSWLPCPPRDRVRWDATSVYVSSRRPAELAARPQFLAEEAAALGLEERESRRKATTRDQVRLDPPPEGEVFTVVVASACGPARRVGLVSPALGLPDGFLALTPDTSQGVPGVTWSLPAWVPTGPAKLVKLSVQRGLEDAQLDGLDPAELEALSRPFKADLEPTATRFVDQEALPFVTWSYALTASFDLGGTSFEVPGPRVTVPRCAGGTLAPKAEQAKGFFGGAKQQVTVRLELEGGKAPVWPPFDLVRGIAGQQGGKPVFTFAGGAPPPPWVDDQLANFTKGMTLVYRVELQRARDQLGFTGGEARVTLG